jgi:two-component system, sensor histidine kinase
MNNLPHELRLEGSATVGFGEANSDLCATLLAMVSHDLRQPLQVIIWGHDILAQHLDGGVALFQLARVEAAAMELADKLKQLVEPLRLHEASAQNHQKPVPLGPILDRLASEFTEPARQKGIQLRVTPAVAAVFSHPALLTGMVRNLMRNAID